MLCEELFGGDRSSDRADGFEVDELVGRENR